MKISLKTQKVLSKSKIIKSKNDKSNVFWIMGYLKELVRARDYTEFFIQLNPYFIGNENHLNSQITSQITVK